MSFVCAVCGQEHEGLLRDWAYQLSDDVWAIPEADRKAKARFNTDLCQYGERYFLRGVLPLSLKDDGEEFRFGVWAKVDEDVFRRYLELFEADARQEPLHVGRLANMIKPYERKPGAPLFIQFGPVTARPRFLLPRRDYSRLAAEQRDGISHARHHEILEILFTPSA